jgi:hypothetical protein
MIASDVVTRMHDSRGAIGDIAETLQWCIGGDQLLWQNMAKQWCCTILAWHWKGWVQWLKRFDRDVGEKLEALGVSSIQNRDFIEKAYRSNCLNTSVWVTMKISTSVLCEGGEGWPPLGTPEPPGVLCALSDIWKFELSLYTYSKLARHNASRICIRKFKLLNHNLNTITTLSI